MYTDADIETAEAAEFAHAMTTAKVCTHDGVRHLKCSDCGAQFTDDEDWMFWHNTAVWNGETPPASRFS